MVHFLFIISEDTSKSPTVAGDVISQRLVAFRDIVELQEQNNNLRASLRELSDQMESVEHSAVDAKTKELKVCISADFHNEEVCFVHPFDLSYVISKSIIAAYIFFSKTVYSLWPPYPPFPKFTHMQAYLPYRSLC